MHPFEEEYVPVNGICHFLLHYPKTPGTPVLLYLHGGPGIFESLFAYQLDKGWGDLFTQVHWDQRGAGKTLRINKKAGMPETTGQMLDDVRLAVEGQKPIRYLGHAGGIMPTVEEIIEAAHRTLKEAQ